MDAHRSVSDVEHHCDKIALKNSCEKLSKALLCLLGLFIVHRRTAKQSYREDETSLVRLLMPRGIGHQTEQKVGEN